ncbi:hypothetical protein L486_00174 [Kwoniella mangroviensis CBS 10435]|uniref:F-box domain-containing protein n=1 Tax=Kwoniella mangroviensis CBS 10435 TaxID=1331196 RepID=A0A1B9IYD7_9TREE|nr:hypothetical protein L486_00174 [Kwoniella mangroviensis CBS 10435]
MTRLDPPQIPQSNHSLLFATSKGDIIPVEIIRYILSILELQGHYKALCKVQQLSSTLYHLAAPYLHRNIHLSPLCFVRLFRQFIQVNPADGRFVISSHYQSSEYTEPIPTIGINQGKSLIKLSDVMRSRYLLTLVRHITIISKEDLFLDTIYSSTHVRSFLQGLSLLPNVESICFRGTYRRPIRIDFRGEFITLVCQQPKDICIKWLHDDYNVQEIIDSLNKDRLESVTIHGANKGFLPPAGRWSVRMSLALPENQLRDRVLKVCAYTIIKASESLRDGKCGGGG